jgi:hypothetical protein
MSAKPVLLVHAVNKTEAIPVCAVKEEVRALLVAQLCDQAPDRVLARFLRVRGTENRLIVLYFPIFRVPEYSECRWRTYSALAFH